jgi:hypothetical protein
MHSIIRVLYEKFRNTNLLKARNIGIDFILYNGCAYDWKWFNYTRFCFTLFSMILYWCFSGIFNSSFCVDMQPKEMGKLACLFFDSGEVGSPFFSKLRLILWRYIWENKKPTIRSHRPENLFFDSGEVGSPFFFETSVNFMTSHLRKQEAYTT